MTVATPYGGGHRASMRALILACLIPLMALGADASKEDARLAWTLHRAIGGASGDSFLSPHSIASCLGMVSQGARGDTLEAFRATLRHRLPPGEHHAAFGEASRALMAAAAKDGQRLVVANALCRVGGPLSADYVAAIRRDYAAEIFGGDLAAINGWVHRRTDGMIPRLMDGLPPNTVFVALNAVYFKGSWRDAFPAAATRPGPFHLAGGSTREVPLMNRKGTYGSAKDDHFWRLRLPYGKGAVFMEVILPATGTTLADAERELSADEFAELLARPLRFHETVVTLPRFRLESSHQLKSVLQANGLAAAFDPSRADLSGTGWAKGDLWLSEVVHKAVVQVDEKGTEAAAVTGAVAATRSMPEPPLVFRADRPFLVVIRSADTVLFIGRVEDPR